MGAIDTIIYPLSIHTVLGSKKEARSTCMHGFMTGALFGVNKQASKRAMHSASWVSMKIGVGLLNGSSLSMPLKVRERTVFI